MVRRSAWGRWSVGCARQSSTLLPDGLPSFERLTPGLPLLCCRVPRSRGCGQPLYTAQTKFNSGCGWPAFYDFIPGSVEQRVDNSLGMRRVEILCNNCGGHLGARAGRVGGRRSGAVPGLLVAAHEFLQALRAPTGSPPPSAARAPPAGHVFEGEGFPTPTDQRHCVNSLSIKYVPDGSA